jgi:ElaA protein
VEIGKRARLEWHAFNDFSAALLYDVLRFREAIFVVEQASPYPDLDGTDERAHHLLLRLEGMLSGYLRLIPHPGEARVAIGRVAVAAPLRRHGLARLLMGTALSRCHEDYPHCSISLSAQTYLARFYETLGFRATSTPFDDYGVLHVEMRR